MQPVAFNWRPQAEEDLREQVAWLEANRGQAAATHFLEQVAKTLTHLSSGLIAYRIIDAERGIRRCPINKYIALYHRLLGNEIELLTLFDTRQDPDKLRL